MINQFFKTATIAATACLSLVSLPATAIADVKSVAPETVGIAADQFSKVKSHFQAYIDNGKMAGATTLVSRRGKIIHFETLGSQDIAKNIPMKQDTIFRIYSMTKPIIGAGLMMLWEDNKFRLDDPVSKFIPQFKNMTVFDGMNADGTMKTVPAKREMTIRDLMRHTSGLTYGFFGNTPVDQLYKKAGLLDPKLTTKEFITRLGKIPLQAQPGEKWIYSVSVDVQGYLIEVLSGMPLDQYLQEKLFSPLGMKDTGFHVPAAKLDRFVEVYTFNKEKKLIPLPAGAIQDFTKKPVFKSGGGGLVSTTMDYWKFAQMMASNGEFNGKRYLRYRTVEKMARDHLPKGVNVSDKNNTMGFGLDFAVMKNLPKDSPQGNNGEFFWGGMANTVFWIDPRKEIVAIFMTNMLPSNVLPFREDFKKKMYPIRETKK